MKINNLPEDIHISWHEHLQPLFNNPKMGLIKSQILPRCKFYPEPDNIFKVFRMPITAIKVVILGQDPYYNGSANGYAFATDKSFKLPASLKVILEEVNTSKVEKQPILMQSDWQTLQHWRQQGVFLLNSALTTEVGIASAHTGQWQWFTREIVKTISEQTSPVWLLWGSRAQSFESFILGAKPYEAGINFKHNNVVLKAPHPAAQTYPNADKKYFFTGCNHFNQCNQILKVKGKPIINW